MPFERRFRGKYAGRSPENASVVRTLFDLLLLETIASSLPQNVIQVIAATKDLSGQTLTAEEVIMGRSVPLAVKSSAATVKQTKFFPF